MADSNSKPAADNSKPADQTATGGLQASQELDSNATDNSVQDASNGAGGPAPKKSNPLKKLWEKFNIYLMFFLLLVVISIGIVIVLIAKSKKENPAGTINTQNLSANALKQLASTGVSIGTASQVLNVESSAVFDGTVLVRNNLEVAGQLQLSDNLSLPTINVSGQATVGQLQAQTLTTSGAATVQGLLSAKNGLDVNGDGSFSGTVTTAKLVTNSLQLNGTVVFTGHITAGGQIPRLSEGNALGAGGTASISGSDTSGTININTGGGTSTGCFASVTFNQPFSTTPHVIVTPIGAAAGGISFYVQRNISSMSICTTSVPPAGATFAFDYLIFD